MSSPRRNSRPSPAGPGQQIAKAVAWLKQNFVQPLGGTTSRIAALLSSTFRQHFRALTGVSPLRYRSNCDYRKPPIDDEREPRRGWRRGGCGV